MVKKKSVKSKSGAKKSSSSKAHTSTKHKTSHPKKEKNYLGLTILIVVILAAILLIVFGLNKTPNNVAAKVGGVVITNEQLDAEYDKLPEGYESFVTKSDYLDQVLIPQTLLTIVSKDVSDESVEEVYQDYLESTNLTEEDVLKLLGNQGMDLKKFKELIKIQIHLNETLYSTIEVTEEELMTFYEAQKEAYPGEDVPPFEEMRADLEQFLKGQKSQEAQIAYVEKLQDEMDVEIFYKEETTEAADEVELSNTEGTFEATNDELCEEDGKPIVRMFSTSTCPHCKWIKATFDATVKEYVDNGDIVAHHWVLDQKDDSLTEEVEGVISQDELAVFQKYNPQSSVPTFVIGCKYVRIGTGYERQDDLASEEAEFRTLIEELIA